VLLGNGDGAFEPRQDFDVGNSPGGVAIGDLNGDATPDLAVTNLDSDTASVLLGNGGGTFRPRQDFYAGGGPFSIVLGDLNNDAILDLVVVNAAFNSNTVSTLLGNGDGTLQARQHFNSGAAPRDLAIGDLNGDGASDLAVANYESATVSVLLNQCGMSCPADLNGDGNLNFFDVSAFLGLFNAQSPIVDFNGDGLFNFFDVSAYLLAFNAGCP
jgi:hypothetical protein